MSPLTKRLIAALAFALPVAALSAPPAMAKPPGTHQTHAQKGKGKTHHAQSKKGKTHASKAGGKHKRSTNLG